MAADPQPSISVDGYRSFTRIGAGGFSSVYRAEQSTLGREVAVKVLHTSLDSEHEQLTFERECRALGLLSRHPNIVTVHHDAVAADGRRCLVMELYRGTVREQLSRGGARPVAEVLQLGVKIGSALQVAHDAGVLHRDVKPHNILLSDYGEPALSDFGISVIDIERSVSAASGLSFAYASPEAIDGRRASRASDIYSLGATLFHLLEGEPPFAAPRIEATLAKIMSDPAPELSRHDVPESLRAVLRACLAKAPADRPLSAGDLVAALRDVESESGWERTPIPQQRDMATSDDAGDADADAPTVGVVGGAIAAATDGPATGVRSDDVGDMAGAEVSARSSPSLWPSGWSPWGDDGAVANADAGSEDTVVRPQRPQRGVPQGGVAADGDNDPAVAIARPSRLSVVLAIGAAAAVVTILVMAVALVS